jgi:hypothetical protein
MLHAGMIGGLVVGSGLRAMEIGGGRNKFRPFNDVDGANKP